ncbi:restriction endonuclease subunit S [Staphylococcus haemolyticus]|uniref:restriction endonuclease subunit S n=1 Tax=Staphylococcus TaxID=1279 RepID=UPI0022461DDD|nr:MULTISPECIES: restriction endonuclease subunit S [Staphylococcus]MCW9138036.1 restriction endonuclease subunit S [Staphylococcus haemolyticus]MCW9140679.1 restriction endonuclease subunit S [Staphylococcus sp. SUC_1.2]
MTEQTNTPKLRFPEFSEEWENKSITDDFSIIDGDRGKHYPSSKDLLKKGDCIFLSAENVTKKGWSFKNLKFITRKKDIAMGKGKLKLNDLILTTRGTVGNVVRYHEEIPFQDMRINSGMVILRTIQPSQFFLTLFTSNFMKRFLNKVTVQSAQPHLTVATIKMMKFIIPKNIEEQEKIGTFFSKLDQQIELEEKKLELLEQQKRGYMQKIFSQELQFKDKVTNNFDNWSEFKIKDIFSKIESGNRLPKSNLLDGDIPYVIAQTTNNGVYMNISKDTLDYHGNNLKKFKKGSITISIDNPDAMFIQTQDFVTSNVMRVLYNENLSIEAHTFILYSLRKLTQTYNWSVKFSGPIIMDSKIKLPVKLNTNDIDWNIVNKIGEFLTKLDFKIYQNTTKVELLKQRKKGLLQKMFV